MARIAVTGGSGFIGTNLVEHLLTLGHDVCNFDRMPPRIPERRDIWQRTDIGRRDDLEAINGWAPDAVVHCAARTDLDDAAGLDGYAANVDGVRNLLDTVRATPSIQRTIWLSTQLVCPIGHRPRDEFDVCPTTVYGRSKAIGEQLVRDADGGGPTWTILRPTSIWGPWFGVPYRNFFDAIARGLYVHPGGRTTRKQWGFVGNAVHEVATLLDAPIDAVSRRTFVLSDHDAVELRTFADHVRAAAGQRPLRTVPYSLLAGAARLGDLASRAGWRAVPLTSFRLHNIVTDELVGFGSLDEIVGPLPHSFEEGIAITLEWLASPAALQRDDRLPS